MKLKSLCVMFSTISFLSCSKKSTPFTYQVSNISAVSVLQNSTADFSVQVLLQSGSPEAVTVSFSGLPDGITITPDSAQNLPETSFTTTFTVHASGSVPQGVYGANVVTSSPSARPQMHPFQLSVIDVSCLPSLLGHYTGNDTCNDGTISYDVRIEADKGNNITISNLGDNAITVKGTVDCSHHTIDIPYQDVAGFYVSGTATFNPADSTIILHYRSSGMVSDTCVSTLNKY